MGGKAAKQFRPIFIIMKKILLSFLLLFMTTMSYAQIGYQVSLLNTATGEPRANEKVSCVIELKNSEGTVICSETKSATSNDFGVISLTVGNEKTFENMDWSKLPFFVSVTIGGKLIGQSQVLTVPVAEYAKKTGTLTYENIGEKKVICRYTHMYKIVFKPESQVVEQFYQNVVEPDGFQLRKTGKYYIDGNNVWAIMHYPEEDEWDISRNNVNLFCGHYIPEIDTIFVGKLEDF